MVYKPHKLEVTLRIERDSTSSVLSCVGDTEYSVSSTQQFCNTLLFKARSNQMSQVNNKNVMQLNQSWDDKVGQILNATAFSGSADFDLMCETEGTEKLL